MNALPLVNEKSGITLYYNMQADTKSALYAPPCHETAASSEAVPLLSKRLQRSYSHLTIS